MKPYIVSLCDESGIALRPWLAADYPCIAVDLARENYVDGLMYSRRGDVRNFVCPPNVHLIMCWPPCTHLAASGAEHFKRKGLRKLAEAIDIVGACKDICEASGARYLIENPIGTLSTYWRKPDYYFDPCDYAGYHPLDPLYDAYNKRTCLWVGGGFVMPTPKEYPAFFGSYHDASSNPVTRSITFSGFANAIFQANRGKE